MKPRSFGLPVCAYFIYGGTLNVYALSRDPVATPCIFRAVKYFDFFVSWTLEQAGPRSSSQFLERGNVLNTTTY
jgi:hypothetical protein